ncbi:MAG TPA: cell division protein FtsA [Candidatus Paceibacterota bacterium]
MAQPKVAVGIDIGTYHVKVVIASRSADGRQPPRILGTGYAESRGMRRGYTVSIAETSRAVRAAVAQAQGAARIKVTSAYLGLSDEGLDETTGRGEAVVERGDSIISQRDMDRALDASQAALPPARTQNQRIIHRIPLRWSVDGVKVLGKDPSGMKGMRLAVETLFVVAPEKHVADLTDAVEQAGIEVEDVIAGPLAASFVTLTKTQKRVGSVLVGLGAETLSMAVFEDDAPISMKVFPTGASDIASDLALGLKIPLEEAEQLKMGAVLGSPHPKKKVDDITHKRIIAMFKPLEAHLKKIGKDELLPAGIVITGGGANIPTLAHNVQAIMRLPTRVGAPISETGSTQLRDGSWSVAYGLTVWGLMSRDETEPRDHGSMGEAFGDVFSGTLKFFKKFLP